MSLLSQTDCNLSSDYCSHHSYEEYYDEGETDFKRCCTCDLVFRHPFPTKDELEKIYRELYLEKNIDDGNTNQESNPYAIDSYADYLVNHVIRPSQRVLDFGAGSGALVEALRKRGVDCDGVETSSGARDFSSRRRGISLLANVSEISGKSYDVVLMIEVIEHLQEPWEELASIRKLLASGGKLFVTTPDREGLRARMEKGFWREATKKFHLILFNRPSLESVLRHCGFDDVQRVRFSPVQKCGFKAVLIGRLFQILGIHGTLCILAKVSSRGTY